MLTETVTVTNALNSTILTLTWRENAAGKWAWFDGSRQVTGAYVDQGQSSYALDAECLYIVHPDTPTTTPAITIESHPEYPRLAQVYGHLSLTDLDNLLSRMHTESLSLLSQHTREFNGNGGRRTGAARATQAGRELGQEILLLSAYRDFRGWVEDD